MTKGQRVLALTFMHGARRRLADRLRTVSGLLGRVECCTVDSFAWRIYRRWRGLAAALGVPARTEGATKKNHILVKPTRPDLVTNLVINTDKRTYLLVLRSTEKTYMASVSWQYPEDQLIALRRKNVAAEAAAPIPTGVDLASIHFRYAIQGDNPAWRPLRALDDGEEVYIDFRPASAREDAATLVIGPAGGPELVNYPVRRNYYIVDRLFGAAELRLGAKDSERRVRIVRTDGDLGHDGRAERRRKRRA